MYVWMGFLGYVVKLMDEFSMTVVDQDVALYGIVNAGYLPLYPGQPVNYGRSHDRYRFDVSVMRHDPVCSC